MHYVLGFVLTQKRDRAGTHDYVRLFKKPPNSKMHASLYNGYGGKIEAGESPDQAMRREGIEEGTLDLDWTRYGVLRDDKASWVVGLYYGFLPEANFNLTDQHNALFRLETLCMGKDEGVVANVPFLVSMAVQHMKASRWSNPKPPMHEIIEFDP